MAKKKKVKEQKTVRTLKQFGCPVCKDSYERIEFSDYSVKVSGHPPEKVKPSVIVNSIFGDGLVEADLYMCTKCKVLLVDPFVIKYPRQEE